MERVPCPAGCGRTFQHAGAAATHGKTCGKGKKTPTVRGVPKPRFTGKYRDMLWAPPDMIQACVFCVLTWSLATVAEALCEPYSNIICWCKGGAIPAALSYIAFTRLPCGKLEVDKAKTDFTGFRDFVSKVPAYADASQRPSKVVLPAGLVAACLAAPKAKSVPGFLCRGAPEIQKMGYPVVQNYGTDQKVEDYPEGNLVEGVMIGEPMKGQAVVMGPAYPEKGITESWCIRVSEYAVVFTEGPLALARAMEGDESDLALAEAWLMVVKDVFAGERYLGFVKRGERPSPNAGARAAAHVLAAAAPHLAPTNPCYRQPEFDDLDIATSCGAGEWHTRIVATYAFLWLVLVARRSGIPVRVQTKKREKAAFDAAERALADDKLRAKVDALLAEVLPPDGLSPAGRASVEAALKKGIGHNEIVTATEGAHALGAKDSELRVVLKYLEMRQNERAAAVYGAIASKMELVVSAPRWAAAEGSGTAMLRAERNAAATVASKDVSWASTLAREAAAQRAAQEEEAASFESVLVGVVDAVIEHAPSEHLPFQDVRLAVARRLHTVAPHFGNEISLLEAQSPRGCSTVQMLKGALRERGYTVEAKMVYNARLCERLPAVAGAAPSSPRTAPVSPRASPRSDDPLPPVDVRADRSRSRDEEPKWPQRSRRAPKTA